MKSPSISYIILVHALMHSMIINVNSQNNNIGGITSVDARLRGARYLVAKDKKHEGKPKDKGNEEKKEKKEKSNSSDLHSETEERAPEMAPEMDSGTLVTSEYDNPWLAANITQDEEREMAPGIDKADCIQGLFRYIKTEDNETVLDYYLDLNTGYCVVIDEPCPASFGNRTRYSDCAPECLRPGSTHSC